MHLPTVKPHLGPLLPRRGNTVTRILSRATMRLTSWRFIGEVPNVAKAVVIVAPHTSNWDFLVGVMGMFATSLRFSWFGKHTLFKRPWGGLMRWLGGIPVDRSAPQGTVAQIRLAFEHKKQLLLALAPEGTRSPVAEWRSGFWRIAKAAEVPILPVFFDYATKVIGFASPHLPTDDYEDDLTRLKEVFSAVTPCKPGRSAQSVG
jgi:1-acyl-sn-glycerol-3-phosphate acyltransferase